VRVLASYTGSDGVPVDSISSALAVNTGPVHFDGFGLRSSTFAPEVFIEANGGSTVQSASITVSAVDKNNNPIADGTVINFWAEYGQIPPTCSTTDGGCSVIWSSTGKLLTTSGPNELAQDGRTTILAWTAGEDSHEDSGTVGSDGLYDAGDLLISTPERFFDRDFDGTFTSGTDNYFDYDGNGAWTGGAAASSLYRGYSCTSAAKAAGHCALDVEVWDQVQIVMATSKLELNLSATAIPTGAAFSGPVLGSQTFYLAVQDDYGNQAPAGTTVSASTESGEIEILPNSTVPDEGLTAPHVFTFNFTEDPAGEPQSPIIIDAVTPSGDTTSIRVTAEVDLPVIAITNPDLNGDFTVTLTMKSGANVPEYTEVTLDTTIDTVKFSGGIVTENVIGNGTSFDFVANFLDAGSDPDITKGYVTITANTPDGREAQAQVLVGN